jgi:ABC-2 type transport system ATP-binding protein
MSSTIELEKVSKIFKGNQTALEDISVSINKGEITGLVGPDAAGKTTLLRLIAGLMFPTTGTIKVCGLETSLATNSIQHILGYMPQKFGLYEDLTVLENMQLHASLRSIPVNERAATFEKMLHFTQLSSFTERLAGKLSGGMKQKLGLSCALLGHPKVLLLDEPSVGVDPISRHELWQMVQELMKDGMAVIWATSYLDEAEQCHNVILLNNGRLLFHGEPQKLTNKIKGRTFLISKQTHRREFFLSLIKQPQVIDAIVQGDKLRVLLAKDSTLQIEQPLIPTEPRFEDAFIDILNGKYTRESPLANRIVTKSESDVAPIVAENLTKKFGDFTAAKNISFTIHRGEVFGLLGPNGAGKSTTFKMLCGLLQPTSGKALVSGHDLKTASSKARSKIGYMAQKFSLYGNLSVKQNLQFFSGAYGLAPQHQKRQINEMIQMFDLKQLLNTNAEELPLGYKQRLALACAIMHEPDVLFLDEPTSGVDPLTRREFWVHINAMVENGVTIMVTTHFMDEAEYCDRIALIYRGTNIASDTPENLKKSIATKAHPDPSLEDAFIEIINRFENSAQDVATT